MFHPGSKYYGEVIYLLYLIFKRPRKLWFSENHLLKPQKCGGEDRKWNIKIRDGGVLIKVVLLIPSIKMWRGHLLFRSHFLYFLKNHLIVIYLIDPCITQLIWKQTLQKARLGVEYTVANKQFLLSGNSESLITW